MPTTFLTKTILIILTQIPDEILGTHLSSTLNYLTSAQDTKSDRWNISARHTIILNSVGGWVKVTWCVSGIPTCFVYIYILYTVSTMRVQIETNSLQVSKWNVDCFGEVYEWIIPVEWVSGLAVRDLNLPSSHLAEMVLGNRYPEQGEHARTKHDLFMKAGWEEYEAQFSRKWVIKPNQPIIVSNVSLYLLSTGNQNAFNSLRALYKPTLNTSIVMPDRKLR